MQTQTQLQQWQQDPAFQQQVGMVLTHQGLVRATSRDGQPVTAVEVAVDHQRLHALKAEFTAYPGIYAIALEAYDGQKKPGDLLLWLAVAGDIRKHVIAALSGLLDRIKAEAVTKQETFAHE